MMRTTAIDTDTDLDTDLQGAGLTVSLLQSLSVAALRHFQVAPGHADLSAALGVSLPQPLRVVSSASGCLLAWRSPTETLILCSDAKAFSALAAKAAKLTEVSLVEQTGGIWIWKLSGQRVADVLARLGAAAPPALGEVLTSRLAELTVTSLCVQAGEVLLVVERVYSRHLLAWIRESIADF